MAKQLQARVDELEIQSAARWADPYARNKELRRQFRDEKRQYLARQARDADLRRRIGWAEDRILAGEVSAEPGHTDADIHSNFESERDSRVRQLRVRPGKQEERAQKAGQRALPKASPAAQWLAGRVLTSSRQKRDPFTRR